MFEAKFNEQTGWILQNFIPETVKEILYKVTPNTNVYFESFFEEYTFGDGELPSCESGLLVYLSKDDYENKKVFKKIITSRYGSGGVYSYISVYKCGLMNRFNRFLFNEFNEYLKLYSKNKLHSLRESECDINIDRARDISKFIGINFIFVPLSLEQEERLHRDYSFRDIENRL